MGNETALVDQPIVFALLRLNTSFSIFKPIVILNSTMAKLSTTKALQSSDIDGREPACLLPTGSEVAAAPYLFGLCSHIHVDPRARNERKLA